MQQNEQPLIEIKKYLRANANKGCKCPACGQVVKFYKRPLLHCMVSCLVTFYRKFDDNEFHHISDLTKENPYFASRGGAFAMLRFWHFVEEKTKEHDTLGRTSGYWRITERGRYFVTGKISVPRRALMFDNRFLGWVDDKEMVTISQCFPTVFDYEMMMKDKL